MNIGKYIYDRLSNDSTLTTILGGAKIYPVQIDQDVSFPAIAFSTVSRTPTNTKDGPGGMDVTRMQLDVYSPLYNVVVSIADRIRVLLDGDSGTYNSIAIEYNRFLTSMEAYNDDREVYQMSLDFAVRAGANTGTYSGPADAVYEQFLNNAAAYVTVTVGTLPTADINNKLVVYRGGQKQIYTEHFTLDAGNNRISWVMDTLGEDVEVFIYP